ncbi:exonuclease domain-containing protein [Sediminitomix flava]|uniref:exonuclease domain-containing protein n=1 Tax=Sediminitomix flava TaxID=379075 RepID=UPI0013048508|nr:exonuclease domain-containing protein [Sediminitomix flava]
MSRRIGYSAFPTLFLCFIEEEKICEVKYAVVDLETTGGNTSEGKITEIAIYIHDGEKIIDEFNSLINPEKDIPPFITSLTGISNKMVADAPKFYEVAKEIVEKTKDCLIVAHNSDFDYNFLKHEFKSLGYTYRRDSLCTVELSRILIPGKESYSLGKLCKDLGIEINGRHRAAGDARATVNLLEMMLDHPDWMDVSNENLTFDTYHKSIHKQLPKEIIDDLPEETGVYYFFNKKNELIYIGKSKNIRKRIMQHLSDRTTNRAIKKAREVSNISFELTGSELVALLYESAEIKKHKPIYNVAQRRTKMFFGIFQDMDEHGYVTFYIEALNENSADPVTTTFSKKEAERILERMMERYKLCQKLCGFQKTDSACFSYHLKNCNGACIQNEPVEVYNKRAEKAMRYFSYGIDNMLLLDKGRSDGELAVIQIEKGVYKGFGFADTSFRSSVEELISQVKPFQDNKDVNKIIRGFLRKKKNNLERVRY